MALKGNIFIFEDGQRCMVVDNKLNKGGFVNESEYKSWDESRYLLVNIDTGEVELHYRYGIPYEHGEPYVPSWGGVARVVKNISEL
ncbi:hypothetical protein [Bacillus sp. FJAT-22090]|uniref:hypothetical protein n=1 Tax=Bacillus sp. FJAT-22090 TaxID=1581038 RepID=UPI0011AB0639|nr:hypothetical protein [Bacillus sp. FJAT-22090]